MRYIIHNSINRFGVHYEPGDVIEMEPEEAAGYPAKLTEAPRAEKPVEAPEPEKVEEPRPEADPATLATVSKLCDPYGFMPDKAPEPEPDKAPAKKPAAKKPAKKAAPKKGK